MFQSFFRKLNATSRTITSAAMVIGAFSLISRLVGILRDRILAAEFGAGDVLDAYYAAFRLPDLVYNLLILGAISAGLIPVFTELIGQRKKDEAWLVFNSILNIMLIFLLLVCAVLFIFAPQLMPLITPGFDREKIAQAVVLSRIMFLSPIFLGLSAVFGSVLQSFKSFFIYSLAPIFYNLGIIIGALYFVRYWGIYGLAWGVILGALMHFALQLPSCFYFGYRYQPVCHLKNKHVRTIGLMMVPRTLTLAVNQVNFLVITMVASTLAVGSLTIFNLSNNLQSFPLGVFGVSFAVAALPVLSELAAKRKNQEFVAALSGALRQTLFFIAPISVWLYVLRAQAVRVVLGSGNFDWLATRLTAASLAVFALGLFAQGILPLLVRAFYALKDSKTPFVIGLVSLLANLAALWFFRWALGFANVFLFFTAAILKLADLQGVADLRVLALPAAITVSSIINLVLLLIWLRKKIGYLDGRKIWDSAWRILFSSLAGGLASYFALQLIDDLVTMEKFWGVALQGSLAGLCGLAGFWLVARLLKMEEMSVFLAAAKKRFLRPSQLAVAEDSSQEGEGV